MKYYKILPTHTETPRNTTRKIANLYIELSYHFLTLQTKIPLLLNRSVREGRDCCLRPLCEASRPDIATMLLDAGADINAQMRSIHDTETALLRAVHFQPSIGSLLIDRGADVNMRDESGRTALYRAINHFKHDLAVHLVQVR